ncbi:YwqJ-related putative deaminase [Haloglycomyces albus]|uniref:YwqJ-related putative deaminase n=1 Tax=Haloglycomyces albus TaxID=526067 RepID=UPI00046CABBB|nr:YwqJ-related putative deaminase [Haloglycomyces albus]
METPEGQRNHTQQPTDLPPNNCPQSPEEARDQLKNQVEESARATREEKPFVLTKNERGPVTGGVIDRTSGESRVYVNQDTPPPDMHPKVKERYDQMMQDTNGQGYAPDQKSRPGSHAEVWAYSDLLNQRGADSDPNANDFLVYNVWNDGSKRDTFARCCANCSYLLDGVIDADKE